MTRFLVSTFTILILLAAREGWPAELQHLKTLPGIRHFKVNTNAAWRTD
jgi:hypothetical protein